MSRKRLILGIILVAVLAGGALVVRSRLRESTQAAPQLAGAGERVVPVVAVPVARRDMPIYLEGLGNVVAYKTVTVKPQVEGRLADVLFREGQEVKRGDVLAQIDPRPFDIARRSAEAALERDRANLANAKVNYDRYVALTKDKLVAQQQADDQMASVAQLEGTVRADEAAIDNAKLQLDWARIRSPIDGVTGVRQIDPGNIVRTSDQTGLVVITQLNPIAVLFTLPQDDLTRVNDRLAQGKITVDAFSRDGDSKLGSGEVLLIDNQINQATGTIRLKAIFDNPQRRLWPNQFVKARLLLETRKQALVIPATAVQRGPQGAFVYVVNADKTASTRPITVATTEGEQAVIARGVEAGEQVVVEGQNQLRPGAKVSPRSPRGESGGSARPPGMPTTPSPGGARGDRAGSGGHAAAGGAGAGASGGSAGAR